MTRLALLVVLTLGLSGCGTILQASLGKQGPVLYGGTRLDATVIGSGEASVPLFLATAVDLPLSLLVDTVLLPYTGPLALVRGNADFSVRVGPWPP